ncbi:MAG: hypothetical protein R2755_01915 [Acidimicrobiales bacterium]
MASTGRVVPTNGRPVTATHGTASPSSNAAEVIAGCSSRTDRHGRRRAEADSASRAAVRPWR